MVERTVEDVGTEIEARFVRESLGRVSSFSLGLEAFAVVMVLADGERNFAQRIRGAEVVGAE